MAKIECKSSSFMGNHQILVPHHNTLIDTSLSLSLSLSPSLPQNKILHSHVATVEEPAQIYVRKSMDSPSIGTA